MKTQTAKLKYLRLSPRKVRLVAHSIKGLSVNEAEAQLLMRPNRATQPILKLLRSAVANAKNTKQLDSVNLFVQNVTVDQGSMLKRHMPRAMGRATPIQKKTSHIVLTLVESEKPKASRFEITKPKKEKKKKEIEKMRKERLEQEKKEKAEQKDKTKEELFREKKESKLTKQKETGFAKKVFRRKSI